VSVSRRFDERSLVIAGAGIGGLALAAGLHQAGLPLVVFERRPALADTGSAISLWPNALAALDRLGVGAEIRSVGGHVASGGIRTPGGAWLRRYEPGALTAALGEPLVVVHRADLLRILVAAVDPSTLVLGVAVEGFSVDRGGVEVRLGDGSTTLGAGLIAADGIHSVVAGQLWPSVHLRYAGYTAWRGVSRFRMGAGDTPSGTWGVGGEFGLVPLGTDQTYWFATENTEEGGWAAGGELAYLRARFSDWHPPIDQVLAATDPGDVLRNDIYDRSSPGTTTHGPVTLIGDAAHPMRPHLGQGGCQALEDAVVLAGLLGDGVAPEPAFRRYESVRRRRVRSIVSESARLGRFIQAPPPLSPHLHRLATLVPDRLLLRHLARIGGRDALR
jgi:2-polyprenyl-6-methoxyphenol hydroxylase-like FAD-dependent oxidoreductase